MPQSNDLLNATELIAGQNRFHVWLSSNRKAHSHGLQNQCLGGREVYLLSVDVVARREGVNCAIVHSHE